MTKPQTTAEVISIGDEMTSGARIDTNAAWLSQRLSDLGINVAFHSTVGDTLSHDIDVFRTAANRADVIVATGGIGPTQDDLTREAARRRGWSTAGVSPVIDGSHCILVQAVGTRDARTQSYTSDVSGRQQRNLQPTWNRPRY